MTKDEEHRRFHPAGHYEFGCPHCEARVTNRQPDSAKTIGPALTAEEWAEMADYLAEYAERPDSPSGLIYEISYVGWVDQERRIPFCIAALNAALPNSDPRKITRERVEAIRDFVHGVDEDSRFDDIRAVAEQFADALASYLPPEQ